jgi:hypothetical protein
MVPSSFVASPMQAREYNKGVLSITTVGLGRAAAADLSSTCNHG